jgi:DNA polymerase-3 subunit epsilon
MNFVAIDFETANENRNSACAVGLAFVEGGKVVRTHYRLIRPPVMYFNPFNVSIHGITEDDVAGEPQFDALWPALREMLDGRLVLAHNASFDMSVLRKTLDAFGLAYPDFQYLCTCVLSRKVWMGLPSYRLNAVAGELGIAFRHHNAEEDARACASIGVRCCEATGAGDLFELLNRLGMRPGKVFPGGYEPASSRRKVRSKVREP